MHSATETAGGLLHESGTLLATTMMRLVVDLDGVRGRKLAE
jgi:hypothetical protein